MSVESRSLCFRRAHIVHWYSILSLCLHWPSRRCLSWSAAHHQDNVDQGRSDSTCTYPNTTQVFALNRCHHNVTYICMMSMWCHNIAKHTIGTTRRGHKGWSSQTTPTQPTLDHMKPVPSYEWCYTLSLAMPSLRRSALATNLVLVDWCPVPCCICEIQFWPWSAY